jgi:hypothetical protein
VAPKLFVSYSHADEPVAARLVSDLRAYGWDVWFDRNELLVGRDIVREVFSGLSTSNFVLILLSRAAVQSHWVAEELSLAKLREIERQAFVLPALLEDCLVPPPLQSKVYADFRKSYAHGLDALTESIFVHLQLPKPGFTRQLISLFDDIAAFTDDGRNQRELLEHWDQRVDGQAKGLIYAVRQLASDAERFLPGWFPRDEDKFHRFTDPSALDLWRFEDRLQKALSERVQLGLYLLAFRALSSARDIDEPHRWKNDLIKRLRAYCFETPTVPRGSFQWDGYVLSSIAEILADVARLRFDSSAAPYATRASVQSALLEYLSDVPITQPIQNVRPCTTCAHTEVEHAGGQCRLCESSPHEFTPFGDEDWAAFNLERQLRDKADARPCASCAHPRGKHAHGKCELCQGTPHEFVPLGDLEWAAFNLQREEQERERARPCKTCTHRGHQHADGQCAMCEGNPHEFVPLGEQDWAAFNLQREFEERTRCGQCRHKKKAHVGSNCRYCGARQHAWVPAQGEVVP